MTLTLKALWPFAFFLLTNVMSCYVWLFILSLIPEMLWNFLPETFDNFVNIEFLVSSVALNFGLVGIAVGVNFLPTVFSKFNEWANSGSTIISQN